jgi:hypothetical protein
MSRGPVQGVGARTGPLRSLRLLAILAIPGGRRETLISQAVAEPRVVRDAAAPPTVKVLAIIGMTRSGSTILDNLLGELDGFFSTGELHYLWQRGLIDARTCGCGRRLHECPVWSRVLRELARGGTASPEEIVRWQHRSVRSRHTWRLLRQDPARIERWPALAAYVDVTTRLYRAIARVTQARVVIDSSKRASDAAVLGLLPGIDPYFVHLVRDPRAVAFSWRRAKSELDSSSPSHMPRYSALNSATTWLSLNFAAEAVRRSHAGDRSIMVRYEDFVQRPGPTLRRIAALVGERPGGLPLQSERVASLGGNHTVSGNPSRFRTGAVELRPDDEWSRAQSTADRTLATAMTLPMLGRYGYWLSA